MPPRPISLSMRHPPNCFPTRGSTTFALAGSNDRGLDFGSSISACAAPGIHPAAPRPRRARRRTPRLLQPSPAEASMRGLRLPSVAGLFYPADADALRRKLAALMPPWTRSAARAALAPHAGIDYSGRVAGAVYARIDVPRDVVLLSFNHRGAGARFGAWPRGAWRTPLGDAPVAEDLVRRLMDAAPDLEDDEAAFAKEHSGEVQVPFLQAARPDVRIAPVT